MMEPTQPIHEEESRTRPIALGIAVVAGIIAAVLRIVPHPPSFSGVGAVGIFGGARLRGWQAFLLPIVVMVLSDLSLWVLTGFDPKYSLGHLSRAYVYAAFGVYVLIGRCLQKRDSIGSFAVAALVGGLQFFLVTNFCEWLFQPLQYHLIPEAFRYSRDLGGLATCFAYALPFYGETPYVSKPFMLFQDHQLSLAWTCIGDFVFSTAYLLAYRAFTQPTAKTAPEPVVANS
ncbi:MAG TPA: DUF6580 family putative transport protein [Gemmataceae bacterium]|nr:DUF6580 family putative transport protein [Gemmataceae bacterium]